MALMFSFLFEKAHEDYDYIYNCKENMQKLIHSFS